VHQIGPSPFQARKEFTEAALQGLADSIRRTGLMQPVIVRRSGRIGGPTHELVAGERRWRAAKVVGLRTIPVVVKELTDEEAAEWGIVENVQREDLNPMERAFAFRMLAERFALTQEQIAQRVGQDRSTIANFIRLTDLEPQLRDLISAGQLSPGHGKALLVLAAGEARLRLGREAADQSWSVRRLERTASAIAAARASIPEEGLIARDSSRDSTRIARESMERRLSEHLGTKVRIRTRKDGTAGRIMITFFGLDQFDGIMHRMGVGD
jgi:ParB family chromosome partitioning protein